MTSEKQIAANGRNALKSTGPRTSHGKAQAARNALKHGLLARPALLPDEEGEAFCQFVEERIAELDPVGALESDLAEQIVLLMWRLKRFSRVEAGLFLNDRADKDIRHFQDRVRQFETGERTASAQMLRSFPRYSASEVESADDTRRAEADERLSAAAEAKRSELALLGAAFWTQAAHGDSFGKLSRYETNAHNRLRRLRADFDELQTRRRERMQSANQVEAPPAS